MFGCEAPSKGIDGGYHRVNKIGDAYQSEPMLVVGTCPSLLQGMHG
jgi:hypothetical protein